MAIANRIIARTAFIFGVQFSSSLLGSFVFCYCNTVTSVPGCGKFYEMRIWLKLQDLRRSATAYKSRVRAVLDKVFVMYWGYVLLQGLDVCWNLRSRSWIESTGEDTCGGVLAGFDR